MPDSLDLSDLCITATASDNAGCGSYRTIHPMTVLQRHGATVNLIRMDQGQKGQRIISPEMFLGANVVLLQRQIDPTIFDMLALVESKQGFAPTVIYEVDDDLLRVDPRNPACKQYTPEVCRNVEKIIRRCDGLFVSTPELAARWAHLNNRIHVLPNSIDYSIRNWETPYPRAECFKDKLVIGWAGGLHHFGDEEALVGVLPDLLRKYPHVSLAICSNPWVQMHFLERWGLATTTQHVDGVRLAPVPDFLDRYQCLQPQPFQHYPPILGQFDIGLAPLAVNTFNLCKSELRLLEYGAWGVPYVAQNIAPYSRFHRETAGLGGYLASSKAEWRDALERLIVDHEQRDVMSAAIKGVVREGYNTDSVALRWAAAIRSVRNRELSTWTPRIKPGRNDACPCESGKRYKRCCIPAFG